MKELKIIVVVLFIALPIWLCYRYVEVMAPTWRVTAAQQAAIDLQASLVNAHTDVQAHAERAQWFTSALLSFGGLIFMLFAAVGGVYAWTLYDKRRESWARAVDGTFALQTFKAAGQYYVTDPNKATFGVFGQNQVTGELITDASIIGPDRQLAYATTVQKTRTVSAGNHGDGIRYAAHAKLLAGAYDKPVSHIPYEQLEVADDQPMPSNWQPLSLIDAFKQSQPDRWLLGQNATGACEFDIFSTVHTGLLGATKCGKTSSTALLMALNAAKHGMKVIALDGAGGVDWQPYSDKFEVYETDYTMIGDQLDQIVRLHEQRTKALKLAGKPNIDELDYHIPSLFVILEEFGRTMQSFKAANKNQYEATVNALSTLMRVSRKTGIYFLIIDQSMAGWDQLIKPNIKDYISYHLGGNQGAAFNAYKLHELKPKGQFWNNGNVYNAWYTRGEAKALLQNLQPSKVKMLTDVQYSVVADNVSTGASGAANRGVSTGQNTPHNSAPVQVVQSGATGEHHPVQEAVQGGVSTGASQSAPILTGKPITAKDKAAVLNIYAMTQSKNETMRLVWGSKNAQRAAWLNEILQGEAQQ